ncbi:hypothetical protein BJ875DRAFT_440225 [Amylocarpus encephaloides]|uniref:NAD dependent epimerase/dehydratase n=1 Tax=Amylocarpus encephaloides TaxID=45428 RepID=A0A9P7YKK7_9HELO|nr:hypothetical protein BJ875DRAFT_440225 [Amylocarpus encephaloides]
MPPLRRLTEPVNRGASVASGNTFVLDYRFRELGTLGHVPLYHRRTGLLGRCIRELRARQLLYNFIAGSSATYRANNLNKMSSSERENFPELFRKRPIANRHGARRTEPMKLLVFGLMRTGTQTVREALYQLGISDVYHMQSVIVDPDDAQWWYRAFDAKYEGKGKFEKEEWDQLLGHCQAVADIPTALFAPELIAHYPEAKVLILERHIESWYTFLKPRPRPWFFPHLLALDHRQLGQFISVKCLCDKYFFGPLGATESNAKTKYTEYHSMIRRLVPKERRLEYKVEEGWGPLCAFLGVDVPMMKGEKGVVERPFPRSNEREVFAERMMLMVKMGIERVMRKLLTWFVMFLVAIWMASWMFR